MVESMKVIVSLRETQVCWNKYVVLVDFPLPGTVPEFIPLCRYHCFVWLEIFAPLLSSMYLTVSVVYLTYTTHYLL